jgi:hypothetical protein
MNRCMTALAMALVATTSWAQTGPRDFARGIELQTQEAGAIFRVVLPRDVYVTSAQPDLADLRVFNAAGTPVPTTIRRVAPSSAASQDAIGVPLFPMYTTASTSGATSAQVKLDPQGAVLEVTGNRKEAETLSSYLIDVSGLKVPLASLTLVWQASPGASFLGHVDVQGSDDLNQWRTLASSAAIAEMQHQTFRITQNEIPLPSVRARYLRLTWPRELNGVSLARATVRPQENAPAVEQNWEPLSPTPVPGAPGAASYDAGGRLPVERVDLEFADSTDAAQVMVRSGASPSTVTRLRHAGLFYTLTEADTRLASAPVRIAWTDDRYWMVETTRDGGWGGRLPRLKLGWHPQELLFLAQGAGPYTLAYGSARVGATDAPVAAVLAGLDDEARARVRSVTPGAPYDLGGAGVLEAPRSWRVVLLWGLLIAAVLTLGGFALRLFREQPVSRQ